MNPIRLEFHIFLDSSTGKYVITIHAPGAIKLIETEYTTIGPVRKLIADYYEDHKEMIENIDWVESYCIDVGKPTSQPQWPEFKSVFSLLSSPSE